MERTQPGHGPHTRITLLAPGDTATVQAVFDGLSPEQRYERFHVATPVLPRTTLRLLADVDDARHVALVLELEGRPAGIARYVVTGPGEAELAIAVVAEFAHRGFGTVLLEGLLAHAHAHGVARLHYEILTANAAARRLVARYGSTPAMSGTRVTGFVRTAPARASIRPVVAAS
jgi:GNAT superfamily N-acetyltransferase